MNGVALYDKVLEKSSILELGRMLAQSQMFGVKTEAQGGVIALACYTENMSLINFKQKYHFIEQGNTLSMRTDYILSEFYKRDGKVKFNENTDEAVDMVFTNKQFPDGYPVRHTLKEFIGKKVATSNKTGKLKDNWAKHPANMLRARCVSDAIRVVDPEIIAGFYPTEVAEDFSETESSVNFRPEAAAGVTTTPFTEAKVVEDALTEAKLTAQTGESFVAKAEEIAQGRMSIDTAQFRQEQQTGVPGLVPGMEQQEDTGRNELIVRMRRLLDASKANQAFTDWLVSINQIVAGAHWDTLQNVDIMQRALANPNKFLEAIGVAVQRGGAA